MGTEMKGKQNKYILLRDLEGITSGDAGYLWGMLSSYVYSSPQAPLEPLALKGELFEVDDTSVPSEADPSNNNKLTLRGLKQKDLRVECLAEDLKVISSEEAMVLLGVQSFAERYKIVDERRLEFERQLTPGAEVCVKLKDIGKEVEAVVRYRGTLPPYDGVMFGVEIEDPHFRHQGTTDGVFRCQRYFKCSSGAGLFVSFDKLSCRKNSGKLKEAQDYPGVGEDLADDVTGGNPLGVDECRASPEENKPSEEISCWTVETTEDLEERNLDDCKKVLFDHPEDFDRLKISYEIQKKQLVSMKEQLKRSERKVFETEKQLKAERMTKSKMEAEMFAVKETLKEESSARQRTEQRLAEAQESMREQRKAFSRECEEFERRLLEEHAVRAVIEKQLSRARQELEREKKTNADLRSELEQAQEALKIDQEEFTHLALHADAEPGPGKESRDWVISRDEVSLTEKNLGTGGWGVVKVGVFRGCKVAVKQIHELIISPHNRRLFEREMRIASQCRHPCLLQFIGATNDDGAPFFVTELLDTNLRTVLEQRALDNHEILTIALDVARALNYLHLNRPLPIIHRDISSANVLLWKRDNCWRAKVSDYGAANFMRQCRTINPGAVIYAAPEAFSAEQSTKIDVYSFGMLLCEMCIRELPVPQQSREQVAMVTDPVLKTVIEGCVREGPSERPTINEVLKKLECLESAHDG